VFDVDGTLTEPRQKIKEEHKEEFINWAKDKKCFISTGSDFAKTKEQIGQEVLDVFQSIYCCMGNETRKPTGEITRKHHFIIPKDLKTELNTLLNNSLFPYRTGNHFEERTGMLNFSVVGRNASTEQRKEYFNWDNRVNERIKLANFVNNRYPTLEASVGGSISIDIIQKGSDKGQVIHHLQGLGAKKIVFVGDKCLPGGNDYGIIRELKKTTLAFEWYNVHGPKETIELITTNKVFGI